MKDEEAKVLLIIAFCFALMNTLALLGNMNVESSLSGLLAILLMGFIALMSLWLFWSIMAIGLGLWIFTD